MGTPLPFSNVDLPSPPLPPLGKLSLSWKSRLSTVRHFWQCFFFHSCLCSTSSKWPTLVDLQGLSACTRIVDHHPTNRRGNIPSFDRLDWILFYLAGKISIEGNIIPYVFEDRRLLRLVPVKRNLFNSRMLRSCVIKKNYGNNRVL